MNIVSIDELVANIIDGRAEFSIAEDGEIIIKSGLYKWSDGSIQTYEEDIDTLFLKKD